MGKSNLLNILIIILSAYFLFALAIKISEAKDDYRRDPNTVFILNYTNAYRNGKGLKSLEHDELLCDYAEKRLWQITDDFSHDGFNKNDEAFIFCPECEAMGENLARHYPELTEVMQAWKDSESHNLNMLGDWDRVCTVRIDNFYVTIFGRLHD